MGKSLTRKFLVVILLAILLPMGISNGYTLNQARSTVVSIQEKQTLALAQGLASQIDQRLDGNFTMLKAFAQLDNIKGLNPQSAQKTLEQLGSKTTQFSWLFLTDIQGNELARSDGQVPNGTWKDRPYFQSVAQGKTAVGDVEISKANGHPAIVVAVPVERNAQVVGILAGEIDLTDIQMLASSVHLGRTGFASIMDKQGKVIAHNDIKLVDQRADLKEKPYVQKALAGESGSMIHSEGNDAWDIAYTQSMSTGWAVVIQQNDAEVMAGVTQNLKVALAIVMGILLVAMAGGITQGRKLVTPLKTLVNEAKAVADGDLSRQVQVKNQDEIGQLGQAFNEMVVSLRSLVQGTQNMVGQVSTAVQELAAGSNETKRGSEDIAATVEEVVASTEEQEHSLRRVSQESNQMADSTRQIATTTEYFAENAVQASRIAEEGRGALSQFLRVMDEMANVTQDTSVKVSELAQRSEAIGKIVEVMSNIASQTNLLALNAAIEAARAGEQGRGFAVVADEVRKLAEQSADAAKEIGNLIEEMQKETVAVVRGMNEGSQSVKEGQQMIGEFEQSFIRLSDSSQALAAQVAEVSVAVEELAAGSQHIQKEVEAISIGTGQLRQAIEGVAVTAQQQVANMEEVADAVDGIADMSGGLEEVVRKFKLN